jgi:hypothetical protein
MWLHRTGNDGKAPIVLYDYQLSRNGNHVVEYLKGFKGYHHCDGYSGYNKMEDVTRCVCWAHLRRKFVEVIPDKRKNDTPLTNAEIGREYCTQLFKIEEELAELSPPDRYKQRLERGKPVRDTFWCWIESLNTLKGSALGKSSNLCTEPKTIYGEVSS